jgi:HD-GYP domain-containing protein (c-di-GMP phosphodiesterase class II)
VRLSDETEQVYALSEARSELAEALIAGLPVEERTVIVDLLARSFVDTYAAALAQRSPADVLTWVDRMCDAHADTPSVARLFDTACDALDDFMGANRFSETQRRPLRSLKGSLRDVVHRPRKAMRLAKPHSAVEAAIGKALARLDRADPLTGAHSRDVSAWSARLADELTLSEAETTHVARCGLLHDIGKVSTPSGILNAARTLNDGEWAIMRAHTVAGEILATADPHLSAFRTPIRSHHERLDGRGYPDELIGDSIPLTTRIVSVADCFSAMTGHRPYRPPLSHAGALEQLRRGAGTQFDAQIVAAMRAVVVEHTP